MNSNYLWLLFRASSSFRQAKIIALTASVMEAEQAKVMNVGCDDFLRKPFYAQELFSMMTKHLGMCYTYAESGEFTESKNLQVQLDADSLENLSTEILLELKQSIMAIDLDKIAQITKAISESNQQLAQAINQHLNDFEYEKILSLLPQE